MKEQRILSYSKGISHSPSGMICDDGELEECVNMEVRNQELVPMEMPTKLPFSLREGERLLLIHNTKTSDKHYIVLNGLEISAFYVMQGVRIPFGFSHRLSGEVVNVQSLGNTIIIYTDVDVTYLLYTDGNYKYLGNGLPEIDAAFKLEGEVLYSEDETITVTDADANGEGGGVVEEVAAIVSKFVNEEATSQDKFIYPFFVRYALRLFDGTNVMHSAPILMNPNTCYMPQVFWDNQDYGLKEGTYHIKAGMVASKLVMDVFDSDTFSEWSDIVSGIDVHVSSPVITYDFNKTTFYGNRTSDSSDKSRTNVFTGILNGEYSRWNIGTILGVDGYKQVSFGKKDIAEIDGDIIGTSLFYQYSFIPNINIRDNATIRLDGVLDNLEVQPTLKDDYLTHTKLIAKNSFVYNSRLNISDITKVPFNGFPLHAMCNFPYKNNDWNNRYTVYTFIHRADGGTDIVKSGKSQLMVLQGLAYLFYPDTDAYKMIVESESGTHYTVELMEHPLLNGAYAFYNFKSPYQSSAGVEEDVKPERLYNKLLLSNVNNPFYFPLEGYYTVCSDKIIGAASVTRPISQGQFGEFPLIVFCSDGNYAMRVDEEGFYTSISPIQEDIVLGNDKIAAMENSVVIITKKGLMLTSGGEMTKIAEYMDGGIMDISTLSGVEGSNEAIRVLVESGMDDEGFLSYVYNSKMAFDYSSNRLFIYRPDKGYSYVYHFENDTVSKMVIGDGARIVASVLDYPDTILQDENGALYSLYSKNDINAISEIQKGFALTRTLKLGAPLTMKTITDMKLITNTCNPGSYVKFALFGSNNDVDYVRVSSRHGKPYKFYRIALYTNLLPKESISGSVLLIEKRREHKLR